MPGRLVCPDLVGSRILCWREPWEMIKFSLYFFADFFYCQHHLCVDGIDRDIQDLGDFLVFQAILSDELKTICTAEEVR